MRSIGGIVFLISRFCHPEQCAALEGSCFANCATFYKNNNSRFHELFLPLQMPSKTEPASKEELKQFKNFLQRADKNKVLKQLPQLHEEAFAKHDCLECAACCKNYSPRFKTPDIKRISKHLQMKESEFIDTYLSVDNEGDFVVKSSPCPFLGSDNYCSIYEVRPSDCARFPYTDEDVLIKRQQLTLKNASFCPITFYVLKQLSK
jgi:uncharacterized protein